MLSIPFRNVVYSNQIIRKWKENQTITFTITEIKFYLIDDVIKILVKLDLCLK